MAYFFTTFVGLYWAMVGNGTFLVRMSWKSQSFWTHSCIAIIFRCFKLLCQIFILCFLITRQFHTSISLILRRISWRHSFRVDKREVDLLKVWLPYIILASRIIFSLPESVVLVLLQKIFRLLLVGLFLGFFHILDADFSRLIDERFSFGASGITVD